MKRIRPSLPLLISIYILSEVLLLGWLPLMDQKIETAQAPWWLALFFGLLILSSLLALWLIKVVFLNIEEEENQEVHRLQEALEREHLLTLMQEEKNMVSLRTRLQQELEILPDPQARRQRALELAREGYQQFRPHYCANAVLDALLYQKSLRLKDLGIRFAISAAVPDELPLDVFPLVRVVANLTDNAAEAASRSEERLVDIRLAVRTGIFICRVENSTPKTAVIRPGFSTRIHPEGHGYGLRILKQLCQEHGGTFSIEQQEERCLCTATLNLKGQV